MIQRTLQCLRDVHLGQSGALVTLLVECFLSTHLLALARIADSIACRRLEMLLADVAEVLRTCVFLFLAQLAIYACCGYATGMTSLCLSVMLVDCNQIVQQKMEVVADCSRCVGRRPQNSSSPVLSSSLARTVSRCQQTEMSLAGDSRNGFGCGCGSLVKHVITV